MEGKQTADTQPGLACHTINTHPGEIWAATRYTYPHGHPHTARRHPPDRSICRLCSVNRREATGGPVKGRVESGRVGPGRVKKGRGWKSKKESGRVAEGR